MNKKLKTFKIDLGGSFPAKSLAVRRHTKEIGYVGTVLDPMVLDEPLVGIKQHGSSSYPNKQSSNYMSLVGEEITAEKFLELTSKDVIVKEPEPKQAFYKYRIFFKSGCIMETESYFTELDGSLVYGDGLKFHMSDVIKFERLGEPVFKVDGQK